MRALLALLLAILWVPAAWADNPSPAYWQGRPHTSGDGVMLFNSGQGVTLQDAASTATQPAYPFGLNIAGSSLTITGSGSTASNSWINANIASISGSYTGGTFGGVFNFNVGQYNVNRGTGNLFGMNLQANVGGNQQKGGYVGFNSAVVINQNTTDTANSFYQAGNFSNVGNANVGGGLGTELGDVFGMGIAASLGANGTHFAGVEGMEIDIGLTSGSSTLGFGGLSVVVFGTNTVVPSRESYGFLITETAGSSPMLTCGICFTGFNGVNPFASTASLMKLYPHGGSGSYPQASITDGIDLHLYAFSGFAFRSSNDLADIDGAGDFIGVNFYAASNGTANIGNVTDGVGARVLDPGAAIVNVLNITPGATGQTVTLGCGGPLSDTNVNCGYTTKGSGLFIFTTGGGKQFQIASTASAVDFLQETGGTAGSPGVVTLQAGGSDTDISIALVPKGAGVIKIGTTPGVSCSGTPTASFASVGGIVTHC